MTTVKFSRDVEAQSISPQEDQLAICLRNVSKVYRLYDDPRDRLIDQIGLNRLMFWRSTQKVYTNFNALKNVDLDIRRGERIGIIGRNGAGKTTLLKLITQNFAPTEGAVEVHGTVQALMQLGIGFHQEFSGYENIKAALQYNGLTGKDFKEALEDVVDFVELGDFLHQPMKTYSLGMNARVQFAAATAIRPDILIIDEVLGAGDAYFAAKSAHRMERLTSSGCTLLLVSHSSAQIMQFCKRCIFMFEGQVREDGPALEVVKHYEEFIAELTQRELQASLVAEVAQAEAVRLSEAGANAEGGTIAIASANRPQADFVTPEWQKDQLAPLLLDEPDVSSSSAKDRISRWAGESGLKVKRVEVVDDRGNISPIVEAGKPCSIEIELIAEEDGKFTASLAILVMTLTGVGLTRFYSGDFNVVLKRGETHQVRLAIDQLLLAQGEFVFSVALFKQFDPHDTSTAVRYDLLSRSFSLTVRPILRAEPALVNLPCRWEHEPGGHKLQE